MNEITLSIIIPVYNTSYFLRECLNSCLSQDVPSSDYEVICVNDGSTDSSAEILDEYEKTNNNIVVYHRENHGVSDSRNYAINHCHGKYIWFVDSDDFIQDNILSLIFKSIAKCPDQIFLGSYQFGLELTKDELIKKNNRELKTKGPRYLCMTIYNSSIIKSNSIFFKKNISIEEDMIFNYEYSIYVNNKIDIEDVAYFYRTRPNSLVHSDYHKQFDSLLQISIIMRDFYSVNYGDIEYAYFKYTYSIYRLLLMLKSLPHNEYSQYYNLLKQNTLIPVKVNDLAIKKAKTKNLNINIKLFSICTTKRGLFIFKLKRLKYKLSSLITSAKPKV